MHWWPSLRGPIPPVVRLLSDTAIPSFKTLADDLPLDLPAIHLPRLTKPSPSSKPSSPLRRHTRLPRRSVRSCFRLPRRLAPSRCSRSTRLCAKLRLIRSSPMSPCVPPGLLPARHVCPLTTAVSLQPPHVWRLVHHAASTVLPPASKLAAQSEYTVGGLRPQSASSALKAASLSSSASSCLLVVTLVVHVRQDASDQNILGEHKSSLV